MIVPVRLRAMLYTDDLLADVIESVSVGAMRVGCRLAGAGAQRDVGGRDPRADARDHAAVLKEWTMASAMGDMVRRLTARGDGSTAAAAPSGAVSGS